MTTQMEIGTLVNGTVVGVAEFGLFLRMTNGETGLVQTRDICCNGRRKGYRIGAIVNAMVLGFKPGVGLSLSIKQATATRAFQNFAQEKTAGDVVLGTVTRVVDFGVFISVAPGVSGLIHRSHIAGLSCYDERSLGKQIAARILSIDVSRQRISMAPQGEPS